MPRGRPRKDRELSILADARPGRVAVAGSVAAPQGAAEPPAYLTGEALDEWHRIAPVIEAMGPGCLTAADASALGLYCSAFARWRLAMAAVEQHGLTTDTTVIDGEANPKGCIKTNPAVGIAAEAERTMLAVLARFGMTPADRRSVRVEGPRVEKKLDRFLAKVTG
jgi:P27 family predicted phage terminase small subunit